MDSDQVICPYNKSHVIRKERMQIHLLKCKASYPNIKVKQCKYNSTHVYLESEIANHEKNCSDKINVYRYLYQDVGPSKSEDPTNIPKSEASAIPASDEENWDNDVGFTYNPQKAIQNRAVIKTIQHKTPSERKAEREEQRRKMISHRNNDI